jgi:hypothetical protein
MQARAVKKSLFREGRSRQKFDSVMRYAKTWLPDELNCTTL